MIMRAAVLAVVVASAPVLAEDEPAADLLSGRFSFFSQPAVPRGQVLADFEECRDLAGAVQPPQAGYVYTPTLAAVGASAFLQGMERGNQRRHMSDAALRRCMAVKGYVRLATTEADAEALYHGDWPAMRERIADRAIAPNDGYRRLDP